MSSGSLHGEVSHKNPYGDYFSLPKYIGTVEPMTLIQIAESLEDCPSFGNNPTALHVAASARIESALFLVDPDGEYLEYRLASIDSAEKHLYAAVSVESSRLENGQNDADYQAPWLRAILHTLFTAVYKDIVCGEITDRTREELLADLEKLRIHVNKQRMNNKRFSSIHSGLLGEIEILITYWRQNICAIPSTARGGDGRYRRRETHDISLITLTEKGTIGQVESREVKRGRGLKLQHLGRYTSPIVLSTGKGIRTI